MLRLKGIRQRLKESDRKDQIVDAAIEVARRDGLDSMTARTVGAEAGISHGLVLHHFRSMQGLQSAILDEVLKRTMVVVPATSEDGPENETRLMGFLRRQVAFFTENSDLVGLLIDYRVQGARDESIQDRLREGLETFRLNLLPVLQEAMDADSVRFRDMSVDGLSRLIGHFLLGNAIQRTIISDRDSTEEVLTTLEQLLYTPATR